MDERENKRFISSFSILCRKLFYVHYSNHYSNIVAMLESRYICIFLACSICSCENYLSRKFDECPSRNLVWNKIVSITGGPQIAQKFVPKFLRAIRNCADWIYTSVRAENRAIARNRTNFTLKSNILRPKK